MKIYLSGPISGLDLNGRRLDFEAAQVALEEMGHTVFNPMRNGLPSEAPTAEHMRRDIEALLHCDAIMMLRRWNHSAGCKLELDVAVAIGLPVFFEEAQYVEKSKTIKFE